MKQRMKQCPWCGRTPKLYVRFGNPKTAYLFCCGGCDPDRGENFEGGVYRRLTEDYGQPFDAGSETVADAVEAWEAEAREQMDGLVDSLKRLGLWNGGVCKAENLLDWRVRKGIAPLPPDC